MSQHTWTAVDAYFNGLLVEEDEALRAAVVDLRVGRALDTLPELVDDSAGPFDFVFIDADKPSNPEYLDWTLRLTGPGSVIVGDNVVRDGAVTDTDSDDPRVQGVRRFTELVARHPRLTATAVQTVGRRATTVSYWRW
ncbi:hypothetical protein [Streptomyces sp. NPDC052015]|uniref:O-methyltransferase n=1 Tax=Streptomyces sp. NPDC052015 TaxID=3154755 RepID=UPI00341E664C